MATRDITPLRHSEGEFADLARKLSPLELHAATTATRLLGRHATWREGFDARVTVFAQFKNITATAIHSAMFMHKHLSRSEWWREWRDGGATDRDILIALVEFHQFTKRGFVHITMSNTEAALRTYVRALDPAACSGGAAEFKSIYEHLYRSRLSLGIEGIALLDLLRLIRNTIHNGGVYVSKSGTSEVIRYKDRSFNFVHGMAIDFVTWDNLCWLYTDLIDLLAATVEDPALLNCEEIRDLTHGSLPPLSD
jgi:hypothetical protein